MPMRTVCSRCPGLSTSADLTADHLDVTGGMLQLADGADLNVATMQLTGGTVNTGAGHVVVSDRLEIADYPIMSITGATFKVSGANLVDTAEPMNLMLTGGTLTIDDGVLPPAGAIATWKFDERSDPTGPGVQPALHQPRGCL